MAGTKNIDTKKTQKIIILITILLITIFGLYNISMVIIKSINKQTYIITVTDKQRVTYGHIWNVHKYLIFTEDEDGVIRVFENTDSFIYAKFNSSDIYAKLKLGSKAEITAVGMRIPGWSMYKNIIDVKLIDQ